MTNPTSDLKTLCPCPFCGSHEVTVMEHGSAKERRKPHYFYGNCLPCDCEGPPAATAERAAAAWNGRVQ